MMMNKSELLSRIIEKLSLEAENHAKAAMTAHADATAEESKSENKYDTRGLEASYLAGAQARMLTESLQNIAVYKSLEIKEYSVGSIIGLTALVELESEDGSHFYFIGPNSGGVEIEFEGIKIMLITPYSPLGGRLMGKGIGDSVKINSKEYEVVAVK
jgi:transcription elongation GreA/GreB family factor